MKRDIFVAGLVMVFLVSCGGADSRDEEIVRSMQMVGATSLGQGSEANRCDVKLPGREESEYDTSGDQVPDVRKVFQRIGKEKDKRLVMICREADLNQDGIKDVIRYYNDEGRPIREEADRDFNGRIDSVMYFDAGEVVRQELDSTGKGRVDTKIYFDRGSPLRAERDLKGRSTATKWQPDRWEYYEKNRIVRMGTDLDGDGKVDRWQRDSSLGEQAVTTSLGEPVLDQEEQAKADKAAEPEKKQDETKNASPASSANPQAKPSGTGK